MKKRFGLFQDMSYEDMIASKTDENGIVNFYYEHFHAYNEYVFNWIYSKTDHDVELAQEIHQETILRALENRDSLKEVEHCKTWLCTIASHLIADQFRERQKETVTSLEYIWDEEGEEEIDFSDGIDLTFQEVLRHFDATVVMHCLNGLSEHQEYVIRQHHFKDLTFQEIADMMGESLNTVSSWYYRGCKKLKVLLIEEGGFSDNE